MNEFFKSFITILFFQIVALILFGIIIISIHLVIYETLWKNKES